MINALKGDKVYLKVYDPLMRNIQSYYGVINNKIAIVEMSLTRGLTLLKK